MHIQASSPLRGLLAGLLALIVFASVAVSMTAGGSSSGTTKVIAQQASVATAAVQGDGDGDANSRGRGDGGHHH
jgi:hypothetical protein